MKSKLPSETLKSIKCSENDTGSIELQVVKLTEKISVLTARSKSHPKDVPSKRSLLKMVGRKHRFVKYLKLRKPEAYKKVFSCLASIKAGS